MLLQKQLKLEEEAYDYSYDKFIKELSNRVQQGASDELAEGKLLIVSAVETVAIKLKEYFTATLYGQRARARAVLEDYFDRPKDLALLLLTVIINNVSSEGNIRVASLSNRINRALSDDYNMLKLREQHPKLYSLKREAKLT